MSSYISFLIKWLLEPSEIRTLILDLHEAIKNTPNSFFKQIQNLKNYPNA